MKEMDTVFIPVSLCIGISLLPFKLKNIGFVSVRMMDIHL